mmetsp:Transcript_16628/g.30894  ORF Transcript_16628/g.30894 Transcript_16628/m.30894 type:complete len:457 (+) Transcript_16628:83-1453(+)
MDNAASQIRFLNFSAADAPQSDAAEDAPPPFILPCCCLEPADNARIVPHQKDLVLIVSDPKYTAMLDYVQDSARKGATDRPLCFVATQLVRGEEVSLPHGSAMDVFRRGELVRLEGLRRASELNGRIGKLLHFHERTGRWHVDVEDRVGVKALALQNLERVPGSTPHKPFSAWRTSADVGGQWCLAEVGVVLHLDKSEEVKAVKKLGDEPQKARKCTFSAVGRARVKRVLNPKSFAEGGSKYLLVQAEDFEDKKAEDGQVDQENRLLKLLKEVVDLHVATASDVSVVPNEKAFEQFSAKCGKDFWKLVIFWDHFLQVQCRALGLKDRVHRLLSRLSDDKELSQKLSARVQQAFQSKPRTIDVTDLPPELQKELQGLQTPGDLSYFDRVRIAEAAPLQQLIQSDTHQQRLSILQDALLREKRRLEAPLLEEEVAVLDDIVDPTSSTESKSEVPRSKL